MKPFFDTVVIIGFIWIVAALTFSFSQLTPLKLEPQVIFLISFGAVLALFISAFHFKSDGFRKFRKYIKTGVYE